MSRRPGHIKSYLQGDDVGKVIIDGERQSAAGFPLLKW